MAMSLTSMNQIRVAWTGFTGGPGVSTHYADGAALPDLTSLRAFYAAILSIIPAGVTLTFPSSGDSIDPSDGTLDGNWTVGSAPAPVVGTGSGVLSSVSGAQIQWLTSEVADGHAVKGRTYIVPFPCVDFDTAGLIASSIATSLSTAAAGLVGTTPKFVIWHRPKKGPKPSGGGPAPVLRPGSWAPITGKAVPRKVVVLTSRRD